MHHRNAAAVGFLFLATLAAGCGSRSVVVADDDPSRDNLIAIVDAYSRAAEQLQRPPRGLDEIKPHFRKSESLSSVLRSPNDGESYVIAWGADVLTPPPDEGTPVLLAYEKNGCDGRRRAATIWGTTLILTDAQFTQVRFPKGHQPSR
jgi:hypothetical protein